MQNQKPVMSPRMAASAELRMLADTYMSIQAERLRNANRRRAVESGVDIGPSLITLWEDLEVQYGDLEDKVSKYFQVAVEAHVIGPWLLSVRGIGSTMAGKLIGLIGDATAFPTVSKLWRYAGMAVNNFCGNCRLTVPLGLENCPRCGQPVRGKAEGKVKGERLHYEPRLKTTLYNVEKQMIMANSPYRRIYDYAYSYYIENRPEWSECRTCKKPLGECEDSVLHSSREFRAPNKGWSTGHVNRAANRKMVKIFLAHLWEAWYRVTGKPIPRLPYAMDMKGHTGMMHPEQFVDFSLPPAIYAG